MFFVCKITKIVFFEDNQWSCSIFFTKMMWTSGRKKSYAPMEFTPKQLFCKSGKRLKVMLYCTCKQSWARDNTTAIMWQCFQVKKLLFIPIFWVYSLWLLHIDTEALKFFIFFLVSESPLCWRWGCQEAKNFSRAQLWLYNGVSFWTKKNTQHWQLLAPVRNLIFVPSFHKK